MISARIDPPACAAAAQERAPWALTIPHHALRGPPVLTIVVAAFAGAARRDRAVHISVGKHIVAPADPRPANVRAARAWGN